MLYKLIQNLEKTTFVPLHAKSMQEQGLLEKQMELWLADNPTAVLPEDEKQVLVISQEAPFKNVTDVLAVDADRNLVVIEIKRGQSPRDVIAQALEYASDVATWDYDRLNSLAITYFKQRGQSFQSLVEAFATIFGFPSEEVSESQFNQRQRIFIVGESIDEKVERTARWLLKRGVAISCVSYDCYVSADQPPEVFLDFNEVVRPEELQGTPKINQSPTSTLSEVEAIQLLPDGIREAYKSIRDKIANFGSDVTIYMTKVGFTFRAKRVFGEIPQVKRTAKLTVRIRPEGFNIEENQTRNVGGIVVKRVPDKYLWAVNHQFEVTPDTNIDAVVELLRKSYEGARTA
jgi:predicted transport protein